MFKVGQKVWCVMFGEGVVTSVLPEGAKYPVEVNFGGGVYDHYTIDGRYTPNATQTLFLYPVEIIKKVVKPSINWEHVAPEFNYLAEDSNGDAFLYEKKPFITMTTFGSRGGEIAEVHILASYVKGTCDWKDSLIKRPTGDSHDN